MKFAVILVGATLGTSAAFAPSSPINRPSLSARPTTSLSAKVDVDPVVICGAGPAGMSLAHILHRHEIPCVVFDRNSKQHIYETGRAGLFDHTAAMIVEQYDLSDRINSERWLASPMGRHKSCKLSMVEADGSKRVVEWGPVKMIEMDLEERGQEIIDMWNPLYPQTELVLDMHNKAEKVGLEIKFRCQVEEVSGWEPGSTGPIEVKYVNRDTEEVDTIKASYVVGCGAYHDPVRKAMKVKTPDLFKESAVDWGPITLGIFADSIPSTDKIIYGFHPDGMGAHMIRTEDLSRYYLEVESDISEEASSKDYDTDNHKRQVERLEKEWTDEKIWTALKTRLGIPDLDTGKITSKAFFRTQHYVVESMNIGRAFVSGDACHSRPYLGARGANNAFQDSYVLAEIMVKASKNGKDAFLNADFSSYAPTRVPVLYESAKFTYDFYRMCFGDQSGNGKDGFQQAMTKPIFDDLWDSMQEINSGKKDVTLNVLSKWFSYCYVQPCNKPKSIDEWIDMTPAGKGVRKMKVE